MDAMPNAIAFGPDIADQTHNSLSYDIALMPGKHLAALSTGDGIKLVLLGRVRDRLGLFGEHARLALGIVDDIYGPSGPFETGSGLSKRQRRVARSCACDSAGRIPT